MGRPSLYTEDIAKAIVANLETGASVRDSVEATGTNLYTYHEWLGRYPSFSQAVTRARTLQRMKLVTLIQNAADKDWRAGAWLLERGDPDSWGRKDKLFLAQANIDFLLFNRAIQATLEAGVTVNDVLREWIAEMERIVQDRGLSLLPTSMDSADVERLSAQESHDASDKGSDDK